MALPTLQDAKDYLRIVTSDEDSSLTSLLARCKATIETRIGYPMTAYSITYTEYTNYYGYPGYRYSGNEIQLPGPYALSPAPVITDGNGVAIDTTTYLLDNRSGKIRSKWGGRIFVSGPYTITATVGLSAHPDYAVRLEAVASSAILDFVAHLYENRNPMIADEQGAGVGADSPAIPPRILGDLMALPCTRGLIVA